MALPAGAVVREGIARSADGAVIIQIAPSSTIDSPTFTGTIQVGATGSAAFLQADGANIAAWRNGTTAVRERIYNTFTDASNGEWLELGYVANACLVRSTGNGTGTVRSIFVDGATVNFQIAGTTKWLVNASGHYIAQGDNAVDIGQSGSNRPRSLYTAATCQFVQAVAPPAAGSTSAFVGLSSTAGFGVYFGSGAPTVSAAQGSLYLRTDGSSTSTRMYVNTNGTTGWTNVTTAA